MNETKDLTEVINNKIKSLKMKVDDISDGGCLGVLKGKLDEIQQEIRSMVLIINTEDQEA